MKNKQEFPNRGIRWRTVWIFLIVAAFVLAISFWLDPSVAQWVKAHRYRSANQIARWLSHYGDWPEHIALGLLLLFGALLFRSKKWARIFLAMLIACALAGLTARAIKAVSGRARPKFQTELKWSGPKVEAHYNSFPSGHTAASTAFFVVLALASWRIGGPLLIVPLLIASARVYVAAHYLSDVAFAAILGIVSAVLTIRLVNREGLFPG